MRIIAGKAKGLFLKSSVHKELRPTSQKVKESLFNILGDKIIDSAFLDAYAGSGSIGIEALSRGAASATFIEKNREALSLLRQNLELSTFSENSKIIFSDCVRAIKTLNEDSFDLIFLDPPYSFSFYEKITNDILEKGILKDNGIIIIEHYHKNYFNIQNQGLICKRQERYGQTSLSFIVKS